MASANSPIVDEIRLLKEKYGRDCRVIDDIGDFAHVVNVLLKDWDVNVKFQITSAYPEVPIDVVVTGQSNVEISELQTFLKSRCGNSMMTDTLSTARSWLTEHAVLAGQSNPEPTPKRNKKKNKNKKSNGSDDEDVQKLPSMKTADDVIKRIMWDGNLKSDDFSVGYIDRFLGLLEKNFGAFSWEDLASVDDYAVLAIPKHRIQYFKYKSVKVWDKTERLDDFFGSTGGGVTISDVVEKYVDTEVHQKRTDGDDDSDDDVTIDFGTRKVEDVAEKDFENAAVDDSHWQNKLRPNYFLCQRITDTEIIEGVDAMQNAILERDPRYADCCIRPTTLHITLCTLGLDTPEQVASACEVLRKAGPELTTMAKQTINLRVNGVDDFFSHVVYGKIQHEPSFREFVEHIRVLVREAGIDIRDNYDFVPHMTILKVSRPTARFTGLRHVPTWMRDDFRNMTFGTQRIDGVHLCSMSAERDVDGFYVSPAHIDLTESNS